MVESFADCQFLTHRLLKGTPMFPMSRTFHFLFAALMIATMITTACVIDAANTTTISTAPDGTMSTTAYDATADYGPLPICDRPLAATHRLDEKVRQKPASKLDDPQYMRSHIVSNQSRDEITVTPIPSKATTATHAIVQQISASAGDPARQSGLLRLLKLYSQAARPEPVKIAADVMTKSTDL